MKLFKTAEPDVHCTVAACFAGSARTECSHYSSY